MSKLIDLEGRYNSSFCNYLIDNAVERMQETDCCIDEKEIWRQIGVMQVIFAARLLRVGKLESYVSKVTGLSLKEIEKVKDTFLEISLAEAL